MKYSQYILFIGALMLCISVEPLYGMDKKRKNTESEQESVLPKKSKSNRIYTPVDPFIGYMPKTAMQIKQSIKNEKLKSLNLVPAFIKVIGEHGVGKTTLIRTLAHELECEGDRLTQIDGMPDLKDLIGTYKNDGDRLEQAIDDAYQGDSEDDSYSAQIKSELTIVAITKEIALKRDELKRVSETIHEISQPNFHLMVFHEALEEKPEDSEYYDEIIFLEKPSKKNIAKILQHSFEESNFTYEDITAQTLGKLENSLPAQIQRLAASAMRIAALSASNIVSNQHIIQALAQRQNPAHKERTTTYHQ